MIKYFSLLLFVSSGFAQETDSSGHARKKRNISVDENTFKSQNLNCHNNRRYIHQVPPLSYSAQLNSYAQKHANKLAATDRWHHSGGVYGENLFYFRISDKFNGNTACQKWHSETRQYDYTQKTPPNFLDVGHFTQMIWKNSRQMGVGLATSKRSGLTYLVVSYYPPGNIDNQYLENVFPPKLPQTEE